MVWYSDLSIQSIGGGCKNPSHCKSFGLNFHFDLYWRPWEITFIFSNEISIEKESIKRINFKRQHWFWIVLNLRANLHSRFVRLVFESSLNPGHRGSWFRISFYTTSHSWIWNLDHSIRKVLILLLWVESDLLIAYLYPLSWNLNKFKKWIFKTSSSWRKLCKCQPVNLSLSEKLIKQDI